MFLGHANPQDNAFTLWLGARLTAAGYEVWSDLRRLFGGETFWNDIEDGLTKHTAAYVPILSNTSIDRSKRGFHDEVALAVGVMRKENLDRFIIPVRLEAVPSIPPPLIQLNYVDFNRGWAAGLNGLLLALDEVGRVPRAERPSCDAMAAWRGYQASYARAAREVDEPEAVTTNWFSIEGLPPRISILGSPVPLDSWEAAARRLTVPHSLHGEHVVTFASRSHVEDALGSGLPVREVRSVRIADFLEGRTGKGGPLIAPQDARRMVAAMLNKGWEGLAKSRGLLGRDLANVRAFYFPPDLLDGDRVRFAMPGGRRTHRAMVGRKGKLGVLWHYALSGRCELRDPRRLVLRAHVLFGQRGAGLITDKKKTQKLRRSLCAGWWNPDWRDRLRAAVAHLSQGRPIFRLPVGDAWADVSAAAISFDSAASFQRPRRGDEGEETSDLAFDEEVRAVAEMPDAPEEDEE